MWEYNSTGNLYPECDSLYHSADELYHYGVLGMKWGMRRAARKGVDYSYKSHGQKKYEKRVSKLQSKLGDKASSSKKLAKANKKLSMYKARDLNREDYARKTNTGKAVVKQLLLGPIGSGSYSRLRSAGYGRVVSTLGSGLPLTSKLLENNAAKNRAKNR